MTIYVYGDKASRTHENQMLHLFLERLEGRWADSMDWIFVIANAMWNGAEIDLACILPSAIMVADFKNYSGTLTGAENGPWRSDDVIVKGGRKVNPYQQLRDNKFSVLEWLKSRTMLSGRNLGHISASVIFSDSIKDQLDLSPKVRTWFYLADLSNCVTMLDDLASPDLRITRDEAMEIVRRLGVQPMEWISRRPRVLDINSDDHRPTCLELTELQSEAMDTLRSFVAASDSVSFSVLGMTSTGKSRLLNDLVGEIEKTGKQAIVLQPNRRLADGAEMKSSSIYSHLYDRINDESENEGEKKVIPTGVCKDNSDCVYLIDNAHLLSNSKFSTPDGKQYGSGHLLSDFFEFADFRNSARKVVFFGDPYQIQRGSREGGVLLGDFQKTRGLKHASLELMQLIYSTSSAKLTNAINLVNAIRAENFNNLKLETDENFKIINKKDAANMMIEDFQLDPCSVWYLAETHAEVNIFTQWIRRCLHGKRCLEALEVGDIVEIYVIPGLQDPLDKRLSMQSGERIGVTVVGERSAYEQTLKQAKGGPVKFHSLRCGFATRDNFEIEIFEEFLLAEKPEVGKQVAVAEAVWRKEENRYNKKIEEYKEEMKLWKSEKELPEFQGRPKPIEPIKPEPIPRPQFTYVRYGYAATVHHAQGMSQPICYVNCGHSACHSEGFFRWLYSALTVAERELILFNIKEIHPFDGADWRGAAKVADAAVGAGWVFQLNEIKTTGDQERSLPDGLNQSKEKLKSVAIYLHVANAAERLGWRIVKVACNSFQEQYDLSGPLGERCVLRVLYNGKMLSLL